MKIMRSGLALRVSLPRHIQRHLGVRAGDFLRLDPIEGGAVRVKKLHMREVGRGDVQRDIGRSD